MMLTGCCKKFTRTYNLYSLCITFFLLPIIGLAQLITTEGVVPIDVLIDNNFGNDCVEIENITSINNGRINNEDESILGFQKSGSNFPFQSGFVLSTGSAADIGNSIRPADLSAGDAMWTGDADLEASLGITNTLNATVVEFDLVSATNLISFNYLLASEEYQQDFPCNVADGFAILIRPTSGGAFTNIAIIPGTGGTPVGINNIHPEIVGQCNAENQEFFAGFQLGDTNFRGRTEVLTATAQVIPEVSYRIKMVIADQTDFRFDSAVFVEANSLRSEVDLGPDLFPCTSVVLDGEVGNPNAAYRWFKDGLELVGITTSTLLADVSGTYQVEATVQLTGTSCVITDSIEVTVDPDQLDIVVDDVELCDDSSLDEREIFDLSAIATGAIDTLPVGSYSTSFYLSQNDAETGSGSLPDNYENISNPQTIFLRIIDDNTLCRDIVEVDLVVSELLVASDATYTVCDTNQDGRVAIPLEEINDLVTTFDPVNSISYYRTEDDAFIQEDQLSSPYSNETNPQTIVARLERSNSDCVSFSNITIEVILPPVLNSSSEFIDACDSDRDGFANFDITSVQDLFIDPGFPGAITYHTTREDAETGLNPIPNPASYDNILQSLQTVFIRVEDPVTGCGAVASIGLFTNYYVASTLVSDVVICDDPDDDGFYPFDLLEIGIGFLNNIPDTSIEFFLNEDDQLNDVNQIDQTVPFINSVNPQTLYVRINAPTCTEFLQFDLIVANFFEAVDLPDQSFCLAVSGVNELIELEIFDEAITSLIPNTSVRYYTSLEAAEANTGNITSISTASAPLEIFATIINSTNCTDVRPFTIQIFDSPDIQVPSLLAKCDEDFDGFTIVDLTSKASEITTNPDYALSYYFDFVDALQGNNPITTPETTNVTSGIVFVRAEDINNGCTSFVELEVAINTQTEISTISEFLECEDDDDGITQFIFIGKDSEILDGSTGRTVYYYSSLDDAQNDVDRIDKEQPYTNLTNPQTIYAAVVNDFGLSCTTIASFQLRVATVPLYNIPQDIIGCDEEDDGFATIRIQPIIDQVIAGITDPITVSVHDDFIDAVNDEFALGSEFTNITNPQQLFVRVEDPDGCFKIEEIRLGVIERPIVNVVDASVACDVDGDLEDGFTSFDLDTRQEEIVGPRRFNSDVTWFTSLEDAENDIDPIADSTDFTNTANPQIVFLKLTNRITGCFNISPLELQVEIPVNLEENVVLEVCENDDEIVDLTQVLPLLTNTDVSTYTYDFYTNAQDAQEGTNPIGNLYNYNSPNTTLYVTSIRNENSCESTVSFELVVLERPNIAAPGTYDLEFCDDDYDGRLSMDPLSNQEVILNGLDPDRFEIAYYDNETDRDNLINQLGNAYEVSDQQVIYVSVTDTVLSCSTFGEYVVTINPLPVINLDSTYIICNDGFVTVELEDLLPGETVLWSTGETGQSIDIFEEGTYSVVVTSIEGCPSPARTFRTRKSELARIDNIIVTNFDRPNSVTVQVSGNGNYRFFIDNGEEQRSNVFRDVRTGFHTVGVLDVNGCGTVTQRVLVIDYPRFFTPNSDSYNDFWQVRNIQVFESATFYIFKRNGKLLATFDQDSLGWDGNFNGAPLPSSDYWFTLKVQDQGEEFEVRGHFSLKR
ncbi:MAG: choice-of-anchor L domain-containing protein [Nonlabens sp.]